MYIKYQIHFELHNYKYILKFINIFMIYNLDKTILQSFLN